MARVSSSSQCDSIVTYIDGVQVKIAEIYKSPQKIVLPPVYFHKLPDVSKYTYDFSLEKSVLDKMKEWRKARVTYTETRRTRLEEKQKKKIEKSPPPSSPSPDSITFPIKALAASEPTILTPQLLYSPVNEIQNNVKVNGLDYSDFDNDTSSPFDNMELKTINEMEELAQVLQPTTSQWGTNTNLEVIMNDLLIKQNINDTKGQTKEYRKNDESVENKHTDLKQRMVSSIVQELQKELERPIIKNWQPWPDLENTVIDKSQNISTKNSINQKKLANLSLEDQKLAKHLNDMGFSLSRVTRAIHDLEGQDNKKIVEYLLAIQSLEDFGMTEDAAVKALALTQYDQQKAKIYYESLCTLRDLGFPEDKASIALLKCNIDQDSALDLLIA